MEIHSIHINSNQLEEIAGLTTEYPYVMHRTDMKRTQIPWHWHEEIEFGYVEEGAMEIHTVNQTYLFRKGEGFFINSNVLASMYPVSEEPQVIFCSHLFHPVFLSGHFKSIFDTKYIAPVIQDKRFDLIELQNTTNTQKNMLVLLETASALQMNPDQEFQIRNLFSEIWLLLIEEINSRKTQKLPVKSTEQNRIQTMLSYIHQNYMHPVSLEEIARSAAVSSRECTRCFKHTIQKTPFEYLLDYRIKAAEAELKNPQKTITEIALSCGFSNSAYFTKIFRERKGVTPSAYRKSRF